MSWRQRNWEGTIVSYPQAPAAPRTVDELVEILTNRARYPSPVRAAGSNHSTTACATADGGTLVDMRGMADILEIGPDFVTVQAGAPYLKIAQALRAKSLQLHVNTEIGNLTAGSAACCATKDGSFLPDEPAQICSYVIAMKLVTPSGARLVVTAQDDPALMRILRSSYGLLGIVYEVTFRVRPLRRLSVRHESHHTERFLRRLPALMREHASLVLYIFPHINTVSAELRDYRDDARPSRPWVWPLRNFFWRTGAPAVAHVITRFMPIRRVRFALLDGLSWLIQYGVMLLFRAEGTDPSKQIIWYAPQGNFPSYTFSMWAFPIERFPDVLRAYIRFCKDYFREQKFQVNLLTVSYRVKGDDSSLLSYSRDGTILSLDPVSTGDLGWHEFLRAFNRFASEQRGIPLFNQTNGVTPAQARRAFGGRLDELEAARRRYDPDDRLLNPYFRALLQGGPVADAPPAPVPTPAAPGRRRSRFRNFGRNIRFRAQHLRPSSEAEVLTALGAHAGRRIRAVGALHSWSPVARAEDVVMDLTHLDSVAVHARGGDGVRVTAGAGCRIGALLKALAAQGLTLPTVGAITKQTIAGAIATGTHGSGASSLSHYVTAIRVAAYDAAGTPVALDITANPADPDPLRAARCSVGCLGIVLSVTLACVPAYEVEEAPVMERSVEAALAHVARYPLTFFTIIPYAWRAYVFRRRRVDPLRQRSLGERVRAWLYRRHAFLVVDVSLHALVKVLSKLAWGPLTRLFYRVLPTLALRNVTIRDTSDRVLTLRHDLYRHVEMEVFVPADTLAGALEVVRHLTDAFAGARPLPADVEALLARRAPGALVDLSRNRGRYTHHYVIPCRRVLADDTLISMTADGREAYALGFFSYRGLEPGYATYCRAIALALGALYGARLHWGKHFPVTYEEAVRDAYPGLPRFRELCDRYDGGGVFRNRHVDAVLGFRGGA